MDDVIEESGRFIAACYGSHERTNISAARYDIWTSKMANKKLTTALQLKTLPSATEAFDDNRSSFPSSNLALSSLTRSA